MTEPPAATHATDATDATHRWDAALAEQIRAAEERDGVPMLVTLHDARPGHAGVGVRATDERSLADGERFAGRLDAYLPLVAAEAEGDDRPDPTGGRSLIRTLAVVAWLDLFDGERG